MRLVVRACLIAVGLFLLVASAASASDGVWAWGYNSAGEAGNGTFASPASQGAVVGAGGAGVFMAATPAGSSTVAAGPLHSLAIDPNGNVWAWGSNTSGELGTGSTSFTLATTPLEVVAGAQGGGTYLSHITAVAAGGPGGSGSFSLALDSSGNVWAWGDNSVGELGDGTTASSSVPVQVNRPAGTIVAIAAGGQFGIALDSSGHVWTWGSNSNGQLGSTKPSVGSGAFDASPVEVTNRAGTPMAGFAGIAAGFTSAVAVDTSQNVWAWGDNSDGELGQGSTGGTFNFATAVRLPSGAQLGGVTAVAAGAYHDLALQSGAVLSWGSDASGQVGNGSTGSSVTNPTAVSGPLGTGGVTQIAGGLDDSYAVTSDGTEWAWGDDTFNELGDGKATEEDAPVQVGALPTPVDALGTGCCALHALAAAQSPPSAITGAGSGSTVTGITLNGTVNPNGANVSDCHFDYGTTTSYGSRAPCAQSPGAGTSAVPVSAVLAGLLPNTSYHFRLVSTNSAGTDYGADQTVVTAIPVPTVTAVSPSSGPAAGGTKVTITGSGLLFALGVKFATQSVSSITIVSNTQITTTSPAGSGTVDVTVTSSAGTSATSTADKFAYATPGPPQQGSSPPPPSPAGTSESFAGIVNPEGLATSAYFQYGLDSAFQPLTGAVTYTGATPSQFVGSDFTDHTVTATVTGLQPNSLYHYRLVTTNSSGTTFGPDATFTSGLAPPPPPPVRGKTTNLTPISGHVYVKVPHSTRFVLLTQAVQVPLGTTVDATSGTMWLEAARTAAASTYAAGEKAQFHAGSFVISQRRTAARVYLRLVGGALCPKPKAAHTASPTAAAKHPPPPPHKLIRKLWGSGHGQFTTQGADASASVQGTIWLTADYCDGTLVRVLRGVVTVRDFVHHRTVKVRAHHSYFAQRP